MDRSLIATETMGVILNPLSLVNVSDIMNVSSIISSACSMHNDPTVIWLRMLSEVWLSMPIAWFGIIGNIVSLVVLYYHRRLKKLQTIVIQLQALAVVDTLILLSMLLLRLVKHAWFCFVAVWRLT